jgi:ribosomal protein S18 acetylase RimI-like enzyme
VRIWTADSARLSLVDFTLRPATSEDEPFLWEVLYQSIHVRAGDEPLPRTILDDPPIAHYLAGSRPGDDAVIACLDDGSPVGAAYCRFFTVEDPSYGFVSADVPEVGMAVLAEYRGRGIGRALLKSLLARQPTMSLSVDTDNLPARALYDSLGFVEVGQDGTSITMLRSGDSDVT